MNFADLFVSKPKKRPFAEGAEGAKSQANVMGRCVTEGIRHTSVCIAEDWRVQPSAPSAPSDRPPLVPLETPWIDGQRYRPAGATEARTRLDLYVADAAGTWIRRHGTIISCSP
jgi:hypothetical protein